MTGAALRRNLSRPNRHTRILRGLLSASWRTLRCDVDEASRELDWCAPSLLGGANLDPRRRFPSSAWRMHTRHPVRGFAMRWVHRERGKRYAHDVKPRPFARDVSPITLRDLEREAAVLVGEIARLWKRDVIKQLRPTRMLQHASEAAHELDRVRCAVLCRLLREGPERAPGTTRRMRDDRIRPKVPTSVARLVVPVPHERGVRPARVDVQSSYVRSDHGKSTFVRSLNSTFSSSVSSSRASV